jgi:predicted branched-subunit amino acid permease
MSAIAITTDNQAMAGRSPVSRWRDAISGARAMLPWLLGIAPFGLVIGVSAAQANIPTFAGWLTGPAIYAGSAQVATIQMLHAGAAPVMVVATALAINARLVLYSGAMAAHWRGTPRWWRLLAPYLLVEPSFAVSVDRYEHSTDRAGAHAHYLGAAVLLWVVWLIAIAVGATAGAQLPPGLHLEFVVPLFLVGEVVPRLTTPAMRRVTFTAVAVAVVAHSAPLQLGLVGAIAAGIAAGFMTETRKAVQEERR